MWFVLLGIAVVVVFTCGIYFRYRLLWALAVFGVSRRARRVVGWLVVWLIYGTPLIVFVTIAIGLLSGSDSFVRSPGGIVDYLIIYPFWFSVLVALQSVPPLLAAGALTRLLRRRIGSERASRYLAATTLLIIVGFAIYTPARILIERSALEVRSFDVGEGEGEPLRIAFVADLQQDDKTDAARAADVVRLVNRENPDLILGGGDWINTGPDYIEAAAKTAGALRSRLGTFTVRGDHEHFAYRDQARSAREVREALAGVGVEMIDNQVRTLSHSGKTIAIVYLNHNYIVRAKKETVLRLVAEAQAADYKILVAHQFDTVLGELVKNKVDLALIAHTHGGQVNPVVGVVHVPIARVETPFVDGRYQLGKTTIIVTSGIGFSIAPFRYASPSTIEIIDLSP